MRRIVALFLAVLVGGVGLVLAAGPASAATITSPTGDPFVVPGNAAGNPQPFTVTASGYSAGSQVFIEQCDGTPPTATGWDPTTNCDLGASPAPATADAGGVVTFPAADPNFSFHPFKGASPQGLFNCLAPGQASPGNGLPDFTNCQFRVSSNNSASTSDQVFRTMTLPAAAATSPPGFTGTPPAGTVGTPYSFAFTGITGSPAPTFALSPTPVSGITISTAGVLSGTPTTAGSFPITVTASNGITPNAVKTFTLVINPASVAPNFTGTPPGGTVGTPYSFAFTGITGSPAPTFTLSPTPVSGITISAAGVLSGTPTTAGSFPITVTASNGVAPNAVKTFTLVIAPAGVAPNFTGTPNGGTVGTPYSFAFTGITGSPAPTFALSPTPVSGITISAAGVLSGTPTTAGSFPITVTASNGVAPNAVKTFTLVIAPKSDEPAFYVCIVGHKGAPTTAWLVPKPFGQDLSSPWLVVCIPIFPHPTADQVDFWVLMGWFAKYDVPVFARLPIS
ncbi:MAG: putative Ig domain-containing protein [Acidimicrobiia bacterium]